MLKEELNNDLLEGIREIVREEVQKALLPLKPNDRSGTAKDETADAALSGDIHHFRLPEVLQVISMQRLTGRLSLSHDGQYVDIYMKDGRVAFATGEKRGKRELLGSMLVNMGRLTQAALGESLSKCARTGGRLGGVLADCGLVSMADIKSALLKQTERSVYKGMAWGEGRFVFELGPMPDFVDDVPIEIRVEDLILEGVRRIEEVRLISEKIPSLEIVFTKSLYTREELNNMGVKQDERIVLELIDGKTSVKGLLDASGLAEFVFLKALYALYSAGIIKKLGPAARGGRTQYL
jgi:hypothetical protein